MKNIFIKLFCIINTNIEIVQKRVRVFTIKLLLIGLLRLLFIQWFSIITRIYEVIGNIKTEEIEENKINIDGNSYDINGGSKTLIIFSRRANPSLINNLQFNR